MPYWPAWATTRARNLHRCARNRATGRAASRPRPKPSPPCRASALHGGRHRRRLRRAFTNPGRQRQARVHAPLRHRRRSLKARDRTAPVGAGGHAGRRGAGPGHGRHTQGLMDLGATSVRAASRPVTSVRWPTPAWPGAKAARPSCPRPRRARRCPNAKPPCWCCSAMAPTCCNSGPSPAYGAGCGACPNRRDRRSRGGVPRAGPGTGTAQRAGRVLAYLHALPAAYPAVVGGSALGRAARAARRAGCRPMNWQPPRCRRR